MLAWQRGISWLEFVLVSLFLVILLANMAPRLELLLLRSQQTLVQANARAFTEAIYLARLHYQMRSSRGAQTDLAGFLSGHLDFNVAGFPTGLSANNNPLAPASVSHCWELWTELLTVALDSSVAGQQRAAFDVVYRPRRILSGACRYQLRANPKLWFEYHANNGEVILSPDWQSR